MSQWRKDPEWRADSKGWAEGQGTRRSKALFNSGKSYVDVYNFIAIQFNQNFCPKHSLVVFPPNYVQTNLFKPSTYSGYSTVEMHASYEDSVVVQKIHFFIVFWQYSEVEMTFKISSYLLCLFYHKYAYYNDIFTVFN